MIRTTISILKKCTIAFVPRLLRGNLRYTPSIYAAFGKFEKFTSNVKSVRKSTKASGDDTPLQPPKNQLKDGISVVSLSKPWDLKSMHELQKCVTEQKIPRLDIPGNIASTPALAKTTAASHYDKCSRVISQIFGEEKTLTPQEDLLLMGPVNMTYINNSKPISDKRTPVITFSKSNSKNFRTTSHVNIEKTPDKKQSNMNKDNFQSVLCYEAVFTKEKAPKESKESQNKPAQVKHEDTQQLNTCLYDVDPEEYTSQWKVDTKALKILTNQKYSEQEIDSYWTDVYETATVNKAVCYDPNQAIDLDTIRMYKSLKGDKTNSKGVIVGSKRINHTKEELDGILRGSPYDADFRDTTIKSTTDKQKQETLDQKLDNIDETPLVEAEKPKVEGFSFIPKVLSNKDKKAPAANKNKLDEVVHRCLKLPQTQVDKILLKEMENLGVPITGFKASDVINTNNPQTKSKAHGTTKSLDSPKMRKLNLSNQLPNNLSGLRGIKLSATNSQADEQHQRDLTETNTPKESKEAIKTAAISTEERKERVENANKYIVQQSSHKGINQKGEIEINRAPVTNLSNKPNPDQNLTEHIWGNDRLDPKYILACNETCPISPKPIVNPYYLKHIDTEAVYERNVLDDYMIKEKHEDKKKELQSIDHSNEAKPPIAYVPLDSYLKTIREGNADMVNSTELDSKYNLETESESNPECPEIEDCPQGTHYIRDVEATESEQGSPIKPSESVSIKQAEQLTETCSIENDEGTSDLNLDLEPYHVTQEELQDEEDYSAFLVRSIQETSEQLQATTKQLQATSEQLHATSQQLHETSEKLQATSEQLDYRNMIHVCASQFTTNKTDGPKSILGHPSVDQPITTLDPLVKPLNKPSSEPTKPSDISIMTTLKPKEIVVEQEASKADSSLTPSVDQPITRLDPSVKPLNKPSSEPTKPSDISIMTTLKPKEIVVEQEASKADSSLTPSVDQPITTLDPSLKPLNKPSSEPTKPSDISIMTTLKPKEIVVEQEASKADSSVTRNLTDSVAANSSIPVTDPNQPPLKPLTDVKDNIKLSELMKIVKERNQRVSTEHLLTKPAEAKKSIPPMQMPRHNTPVFKTPSYPKLKPRPRVCAPRKRSGPKKSNCSRCNLETLGLDNDLGPRFNRPETAEYIYDQAGQGIALTYDPLPSANLTEEIVFQLKNMGYILESAYQRGKVTLESAVLAKTRFQFSTKSFEPWTPIPSWPFPKKIKRQKVQCPKDGCPTPPPKSIYDPPCGLKPCTTFPTHPKRTFTIFDYCTIALSDHTVVDIGDF